MGKSTYMHDFWSEIINHIITLVKFDQPIQNYEYVIFFLMALIKIYLIQLLRCIKIKDVKF